MASRSRTLLAAPLVLAVLVGAGAELTRLAERPRPSSRDGWSGEASAAPSQGRSVEEAPDVTGSPVERAEAAAIRSDDEAAPRAGHLLVVVHDRADEPVEGAWVQLLPAPEGDLGGLFVQPSWGTGEPASTDAAGRAIVPLPPGAGRVVAHAMRGTLIGTSEPAAADRWRVVLTVAPPDPPPPGLGSLRLRLRAGGGPHVAAPLELALARQALRLDGRYGEPAGRAVVRGTTDGAGELVVGRVPTGAYALRLTTPGFADVALSAVIEAAAVELDLELLDRGHALSGELVLPRGVAAADVRVRVVTPRAEQVGSVDPAGRWRADRLPAGRLLVIGRIAGHAPRWGLIDVGGAPSAVGPALSWADGTTLRGRLLDRGTRLPVAKRRVAIALRRRADGTPAPTLARPASPFVNRMDTPGAPTATAEARARSEAVRPDLALEGRTDDEGRFELRGLEPGTHWLDVGERAPVPIALGTSSQRLDDLLVGEPDDEALRLSGRVTSPDAPLGAASVQVVDREGRVITGAPVDPGSGEWSLEVRVREVDPWRRPGAGEGSEDAPEAETYAPGAARVWLQLVVEGLDAEGRALFSAPRTVSGASGAVSTSPLDLEVRRGGLLVGQLRLPPALAGRAAEVVLRADADWLAIVPVTPEGAFEAVVPAGRDVQLRVDGSRPRAVRLEPGEERELVLDLGDRPVLLPVQLVGADPGALAVACVTPEADPSAAISAPLHGGTGVVPGLPSGAASLVVTVEAPSTGTFWTLRPRRLLLVASPAPEVVSLSGPRGRLRCVVEGQAHGVRATSTSGPVERAEVLAGPDGDFLLELPVGTWTVAVDRRSASSAPDREGAAAVDVHVEAERTVEARLVAPPLRAPRPASR